MYSSGFITNQKYTSLRFHSLTCKAVEEDETSNKPEFNRREFIGNAALAGLWGFVGYDLVQDLGFSVGDNALPVPPYEGIEGVGSQYKVAAFAGGCFWCMEPAFDKLGPGVAGTISGYTGGVEQSPTYREVAARETGHREAVQVVYDPKLVSYESLLNAYWHSVDPTQENGQFVDVGPQYTTAIYFYDEEQRKAAEKSKLKLSADKTFGVGKPIVTEIVAASDFWPAEKYHQNYYETHAVRYKFYRSLSGRDEFIQSVWGPKAVYGNGELALTTEEEEDLILECCAP
eukprot:CAMPEP_0196587114 /NCGR_PEP_ID=MMETSP1081-20130531/56494_1 /TAXON_ID=36882 /ORGANISM="Pyramimonas amylifera, Strain CCMP720" /LENGTH=286 /DNA_ID=CAMNT_0041909209 /DNA_START=116 /DNA_END=976 /DNA_ORIENTATION=-